MPQYTNTVINTVARTVGALRYVERRNGERLVQTLQTVVDNGNGTWTETWQDIPVEAG
jgi:hypothetical protein